jgi:hypothetical protein
VSKRNQFRLLALALLFFAGTIAWLAIDGSDEATRTSEFPSLGTPTGPGRSSRHEQLVNKHLQQMQREQALKEMRMQVQNHFMAPKIGETLPMHTVPDPSEAASLDTRQEDDWTRINRDLDPVGSDRRLRETPDQVVQDQIMAKQQAARQLRAERLAFIRNYIENARRQGYEVRVNANLVVESVRPIPGYKRNPSSEDTPGAAGAQ